MDPADSLAVIDFLISSKAATLPQLVAGTEALEAETAKIKPSNPEPFLEGFRIGIRPDPRK